MCGNSYFVFMENHASDRRKIFTEMAHSPHSSVSAILALTVNIGYSADPFPRDFMPGIRNFDLVIEIHGALLSRVNYWGSSH